MDREDLWWLTLWTMVAIAVCVVVGIGCIHSIQTTKMYTDNGYEQVTLPGHNGLAWVKSK